MNIFGSNYSDDLFLIKNDLDMEGNRIKDLRNPLDSFDAVNKRYMHKRIEFKTKELEKKLDKLTANTAGQPIDSDLDMRNHRIINVGHPRDPKNNPEHENDVVTALYLNELLQLVEERYLKKDEDGILDGHLEMNRHRITGLLNPVGDTDAVTKEYVHLKDKAFSDALATMLGRLEQIEKDQSYLKKDEDGHLNMNSRRIKDLSDPVDDTDAATMHYVKTREGLIMNLINDLFRRVSRLERRIFPPN